MRPHGPRFQTDRFQVRDLVMAEKTRSYLEMSDPHMLRRGSTPPSPVTIEPTHDLTATRALYARMAPLYDWPPVEEWATGFEKPGRHYLFLKIDGEVAGIGKLIEHADGDVEISNFGLREQYIGKGFGAAALAGVAEHAWGIARSKTPGSKIKLDTCSSDHPHALANYKARGFVVVRTEELQ